MPWIIGLNALRFFAICLIAIYHFARNFLPGGFLAIEIFFVLSGFLLARKLLTEYRKTNTLKIGQFIKKRFLRIWPALIFCIFLILSLTLLASRDAFSGAPLDALFAGTFLTNFSELLTGGGYEDMVSPNLFEHCWFLAVEFQLCLILPVLLKSCIAKRDLYSNNLHRMLTFSLAATLISMLLMIFYGGIFNYPSRAYFSLDTQAFGFFAGVSLAIWQELKIIPDRNRRWSNYIYIFLSISAFILMSIFVKFDNPLTFSLFLPLSAMLSVMLIRSIIKLQHARAATPTPMRPFEFLGKYSYAIYLFHWPLYLLLPRIFPLPLWVFYIVCPLLSLIFSLILSQILKLELRKRLLMYAMPAGFAAASAFLIPLQSPILEELEQNQEKQTEQSQISYVQNINFNNGFLDKIDETVSKINEISPKNDETKPEIDEKGSKSASDASRANILIIGDSVTLGAKPALEGLIASAYVDATESRGIEKAHAIIDENIASGGSPSVIVVSLATNERYFSDFIMQQIVDSARGAKVIFVTGYAGTEQPREGQNDAIRNFANSHENVSYADWWEIARNNWDYLYGDHIHLNPAGQNAYAQLIYNAVAEVL